DGVTGNDRPRGLASSSGERPFDSHGANRICSKDLAGIRAGPTQHIAEYLDAAETALSVDHTGGNTTSPLDLGIRIVAANGDAADPRCAHRTAVLPGATDQAV